VPVVKKIKGMLLFFRYSFCCITDLNVRPFMPGRLISEKIRKGCRVVVLTSSNSVTDREQVFLFDNVIHMITNPLKQSDIEAVRILVTR